MKKYSYVGKLSNFKYTLLSFLIVNKVKIIVMLFVVAITLLTGIFTASKYLAGGQSISFKDYGIVEFANGSITTVAIFFKRTLSFSVVLLLLLLCSLYAPLFPLSLLIIAYRSFLLGLNITLIVVLYGFSGIFVGILIIFPFQLLILCLMCGYFLMSRNKCLIKTRYGKGVGVNPLVLLLIFILILSLVNICETVLLVVFSANVILVI